MKPPFPWQKFLAASMFIALIIAAGYALAGYAETTYHPVNTGIEFLDPTPGERSLTAIQYGCGAFACALVGAFVLLCLLRWTWYFLLARLSELSQAIKTNP